MDGRRCHCMARSSSHYLRSTALLLFLSAAHAGFAAGAVELPDKAPLPAHDRVDRTPAAGGLATDNGTAGQLPDSGDPVPLPEPKPAQASGPAPRPSTDGQYPDQAFLPDRRAGVIPASDGTLPAAERECRQQLQALGAKFENRPAETDEAGCSIPYPVVLSSLGPNIELVPDALMNCAMAKAAANFANGVISPAARAEFERDVKSVTQASAFVCRPRNGTRRLSEHAFGNALDIASFTLDTNIAVEPEPDARAARFLERLRGKACGPFKTVLGPGSDADHALHFHFDLRQRRNGGTFCQ